MNINLRMNTLSSVPCNKESENFHCPCTEARIGKKCYPTVPSLSNCYFYSVSIKIL